MQTWTSFFISPMISFLVSNLAVKVKVKSLSHVRLFVTTWTVAYQAPPSMEFSRQEYWSGLPFPSPGIFLTQGSNPGLLHCRLMLYRLSHQGSSSTYILLVHSSTYILLSNKQEWRNDSHNYLGEVQGIMLNKKSQFQKVTNSWFYLCNIF